MATREELEQKINKLEVNMDRTDRIVNGEESEDVLIDDGQLVPSIRKWQKDMEEAYAVPPQDLIDAVDQSKANATSAEDSATSAEEFAQQAVAAVEQVEQDAEQIAQDAAQQAASVVIAGVDGQVTVAQSAADRAETASGAAFVNADVYPDVATGLAAVGEDQQFQVISGNGLELIRYVNDAGAGREVARFPSSDYLREVSRVEAFRYGQPNLFSVEQLSLTNAAAFSGSAAAKFEIETVNNRKTLRVYDGSLTVDWPASMFSDSGLVSASLWVEKLQGATSLSRIRLSQAAYDGPTINYLEDYFGTEDFDSPRQFFISGMALHPDADFIRLTVQTSLTTGSSMWIRDFCVCSGSDWRFRDVSQEEVVRNVLDKGGVVSDEDLESFQAEEVKKWAEFRDVWREGSGLLSVAEADRFTERGFLNSDGTFTESLGGYLSTEYIPIGEGEEIRYRASAGTTPIVFYGESFDFLLRATGSDGATERTITSPPGSRFIRMSNLPSNLESPYARTFLSDTVDERIESYGFLPESEVEVIPSSNLAAQQYFVEGQYITNTGSVGTVDGWNMYRIPVKPDTDYTFGNFVVDTAGYSAFLAEDNTLIQYNGSHGNGSPKTFRSPAVPSYLCIGVSRPTNTPEDYARVIVNEGDELLPYEEPVGTVVSIAGNRIAGDVNPAEFARLGFDANFTDVVASSISASTLILNLPSGTTVPPEVEVNQAWIDEADSSIKVRLS